MSTIKFHPPDSQSETESLPVRSSISTPNYQEKCISLEEESADSLPGLSQTRHSVTRAMSEGEKLQSTLARHPTEDWDANETSTVKKGESKEEKSKLGAQEREALGEWINASSSPYEDDDELEKETTN
ncbi:uncharacterized protein BT62DRAFT_919347 [Guyanagaster necrorhizus]|uniref:Uncharacterized protein n=1 Tax=Guyanagaster necrorhizus TaxID=856835 RepID=A0A9P8AUC0_9AGAR|nr:uncharacterized protein BT62DRAFT_919347 [Guyanagaster necrorhizus MCA 3950]KAG7446752.1 hypothetical protein BT62DRAFT_919347 [Guyanagaster necrorhizus MCA 3950]